MKIQSNVFDISICPLFFCNLDCKFCYIKDKKSKDLLDLSILESILSTKIIRNLDIYGGEITILPEDYAKKFINILDYYRNKILNKITFVSNCLNVPNFWLNVFKKYDVCFSIDKQRKNYNKILNNIKKIDKENYFKFSLISVDIDHIDFQFLNSLSNLKSFSVKPYSPADKNIKYKSYMLQDIKKLITFPKLFKKIELPENTRDLVPHIFLLPDGKLYNIEYNDSGIEHFVPAFNKLKNHSIECLCCEYYKQCFNEHYSGYKVQKNQEDCIGRKKVLKFLNDLHYLS